MSVFLRAPYYTHTSTLPQACRVCNTLGDNCRVVKQEMGDGIPNADFVFYISALETERCRRGYTVAYAAHCQQEAALDRYGKEGVKVSLG